MESTDLIARVLEQHRDYEARTPASTLKDFLEGSIHQDFLHELAVRIEQMRDINEACESKMYLETRGGIKALRMVSGIFHDLYHNAINQTEMEEHKDGR